MGVVFLAQHLRLKRNVALKILAAELSDDETFRQRFIRESQLAASLDHKNIIPIYDANEDQGHLYIAMRYVAGTDLARVLRSEIRLAPEQTLKILGQIAGALDAAHAKQLVHRDVKPGNILIEGTRGPEDVDGFETCYLADFGLTRKLSYSSLTDPDTFVGTIDYTTPEVIEGHGVDGRTDVYSLGCVLFECLTGSVPFPRESDVAKIYAHLQDSRPLVTIHRPDLPPAIDQVVTAAMAVRKNDRFPTCGALMEAARASLAIERGTIPPRRRSPTPAPRRWWRAGARNRLRRRAWALLALPIVGLGGVLFYLIPRHPLPAVPGVGPTHIWALSYDRSERRATGYQEIKVGGNYEVEPSVSPDGIEIAFTSKRGGNTEIYVMNVDGSQLSNLTGNPARDEEPAWSRDGTSIAFASDRGRNFDIYVMDADGKGLTQLTHDSAKDLDPTWSPDGTRIAFSKTAGSTTQIYVMSADGGPATQITSEGSNFSPAWSPDGEWIACVSNRDGDRNIYLISPDGKQEPARLTKKSSAEYSPAWAADSKWLAYVSTRSGANDIWVMDTVGQKTQDLTPGPEAEFGPVWSGDTIYYARTEASS